MSKSEKPILKILSGEQVSKMPVWFMRQAGRYLPEYQEVRAKARDFIHFCLSPDLASEVTLQPVNRFGLDAAILFADILLIPYALQQPIKFVEKEGPLLEPVHSLSKLNWNIERVAPVFETLERVRNELDDKTSLIGFSGGLWTVACYMIDGTSKNDFTKSVHLLKENPSYIKDLIDILHDATLEYLGRQIEAGAEIIQIFESHAGLLHGTLFDEFVTKPTARLVQSLKKEYPDVPVIGFPRGADERDYEDFTKSSGVDAVSIDQFVSLPFALDKLQPHKPLQGNLDPLVLLRGGARMFEETKKIYDLLGPRHIFNLGHGIVKETPPEYVKELVQYIRSL